MRDTPGAGGRRGVECIGAYERRWVYAVGERGGGLKEDGLVNAQVGVETACSPPPPPPVAGISDDRKLCYH